MALNGATLVKRGTGAAGEQPNGIAAQYQLAGTKGLASTAIMPYDSGNIMGHVNPGKPAAKLVNGTIQNATDLICNNQPLGNTLPAVTGSGLVASENPVQTQTAGLSLAASHE
jgi:hypothetical protein